ncbi:unnamed protein product [Phyllotreta striolata]|uniref:L-2-hydroxyglutarate dehydrogenase, mitochondrial n=1 Tax=Phyllotreta striolata TaxID=444603 RepID=A0A9N9TZY3_PHYSR|nr:unnamed protein product [Phyllotreta striolata]
MIKLHKLAINPWKNVVYPMRTFSSLDSKKYDIIVVGGGIVGCATARELKKRQRHLKIALVEKEKELAFHQSGHNSGVIHAGIYYTPGSLKAKLCVEGLRLAYRYCDEKGIPYKKVGKLIVATDPEEVQRLHVLHDRGIKNDVPELTKLTGPEEIRKIEPLCTGLEALWSPHTGIVDWKLVTNHYAEDFKQDGGEIYLNFEVNDFRVEEESPDNVDYPIEVRSAGGVAFRSKFVLTCGGLHSDRLAELSGCSKSPKIVPFRGEYLVLAPEKARQIKANIYPVPDPRFPFLGVHFTPRMDGSVWIGPNAVFAFKKEGYKWSDFNLREFAENVTYPGFLKLAVKYMRKGGEEMVKSFALNLMLNDLRKFVPSLRREDILPGQKAAGVRAQALDIDGNLVDDFYFDTKSYETGGVVKNRVLHCRNAPSPGATSSLAIAKMIADKCENEFQIRNG